MMIRPPAMAAAGLAAGAELEAAEVKAVVGVVYTALQPAMLVPVIASLALAPHARAILTEVILAWFLSRRTSYLEPVL